jgi:hypothetical protein
MENELPVSLNRELEMIGVIAYMPEAPNLASNQAKNEHGERTYTYRRPNFDENGEPDF